jgi:guanylate cyclase
VILEDLKVMTRFPVFNGLFSATNAALVATLMFTHAETSAAWVTVTTGAVYLGAVALFAMTGRADLYVHLVLWSSLVQNVTTHIILGGFTWSGGFLMWGIIVSVAGALFLGRTPGLILSGGYLIAALVLGVLEPALQSRRSPPEPFLSSWLALDVFAGSILILVPLVMLLMGQISSEQARSQRLLLNVLPKTIADRLKLSPGVIAEEYDSCTVLFADIVGFTDHSSKVPPERLVTELNVIFSRFDRLVDECGAEKIKTMGDGYLAVSGAPNQRPDHALLMCELALRMQEAMSGINDELESEFQLRVGLNTGRLVAGVVGTSRFSYDLWGDTVNVASRMETLSRPGAIRVTEAVAMAANRHFAFTYDGLSEVKGKGSVPTYLLIDRIGAPAGAAAGR